MRYEWDINYIQKTKDGYILPADEAVPDGGVEDVGLGLCAGVVRGEAAGEDEAGAGEGGVGAAGQHRDADLAPSQQHCTYQISDVDIITARYLFQLSRKLF